MPLARQHRARVLMERGASVSVTPGARPTLRLVLAYHAVGLSIEGDELLSDRAGLKILFGYYIHKVISLTTIGEGANLNYYSRRAYQSSYLNFNRAQRFQ